MLVKTRKRKITGSREPSQQDRDITHRLVTAGETLGIQVIDHVIVTEDNYYSFAENNEV